MKLAIILLISLSLLFNPMIALASGNDDTVTATLNDSGFHFSDLAWSESLDTWEDYRPNEAVFSRGTRAYAYIEVTGFTNEEIGGEYQHDLTVDIYLRTGIGIRLFNQKNVIEFEEVTSFFQESVSFYIWVDIPWWAPSAAYYAEVIVHDRINETEIRHEEKLTIQ